MISRSKSAGNAMIAWPDERLVQECLDGNQEAWDCLIDKYKNLIFSIPIKYGMSRDDAAEIFQRVCLRLVSELPNLRNPACLPAWLIKVSSHECSHWARHAVRYQPMEGDVAEDGVRLASDAPDHVMLEVEQERLLREALLEMAPRCRRLVRMLFFETPARSYEAVAETLGLAKNSIGFLRMRCLERLRKLLERKGFQ